MHTTGQPRRGLAATVRLHNETRVTVTWIAQRLPMGNVAHEHTLLYQWRLGTDESLG